MSAPTQTAAVKDILINQGADFDIQLTITQTSGTTTVPVNITGYTFTAKVKETANDTDALATFTQEDVDYVNGIVRLHLDGADTANITTDGDNYAKDSHYYWDVLMAPAGKNPQRILNGSAYVSPGISQ